MENKISYFVIIGIIILVEFFRKKIYIKFKREDNILSPTNVLRLYWIGNLIVGIILKNKIIISLNGVILILYFIYLFDFGYFLGIIQKRKNEFKIVQFNKKKYQKLLHILNVIAIIIFFILIKKLNVSIDDFRDWNILHEKIKDLAEARYLNTINLGKEIQILIGLLYTNIILFGFYIGLYKKRFYYGVAIIVLLIYGFLVNTKATLIYTFMCYMSGYLTSEVYLQKNKSWKKYIKFIGYGIGIFLCMIFMMKIRTKIVNEEKIIVYSIGHISAITNWININVFQNELKPNYVGKYTFLGPFSLLGIFKKESGVFLDFIKIGNNMDTNVYTLWRNLLEDFGVSGVSIIMLITGYIMSKIYNNIRLRKINIILYALFVGVIMLSALASFFVYNSLIIAYIFAYMFLLIL